MELSRFGDLEAYARRLSSAEPPLLREIRETTGRELAYDDMLSGPVVGALLQLLVGVSGARIVLEVGTFTGYATLWMARGLPSGGRVLTCETNDRYARIAERFFSRYRENDDRAEIRMLFGPALQTIRQYVIPDTPPDFVFLDADKEHYPDYYDLLMPVLRPGGLMVIDNAFWGGKVLHAHHLENAREQDDAGTGRDDAGTGPIDSHDSEDGGAATGRQPDRKTGAIDRLNRRIAEDPGVQNVMLTVRDGLHIVRKIS